MKNSGGERMHCPYRECILLPTAIDVGSEFGIVSVLTFDDVYRQKCPRSPTGDVDTTLTHVWKTLKPFV